MISLNLSKHLPPMKKFNFNISNIFNNPNSTVLGLVGFVIVGIMHQYEVDVTIQSAVALASVAAFFSGTKQTPKPPLPTINE